MAINPDVEGVVGELPNPDESKADRWVSGDSGAAATPAPDAPVLVVPEVTKAAENIRSRRSWVGAVAVCCVGVIAAGTLGYFLYSTSNQRDSALRQVATIQATLASTEDALNVAQQDLIARKAISAYTNTYVTDSGRVRIDYQQLEGCTKFGPCRTAAQSLLTNLQSFQSDRVAAGVPSALANSDSMLRDALSAAIAASQELISGMDSGSANKFRDGWRKLGAAMLSMAKAEAALGVELK